MRKMRRWRIEHREKVYGTCRDRGLYLRRQRLVESITTEINDVLFVQDQTEHGTTALSRPASLCCIFTLAETRPCFISMLPGQKKVGT